MTWSVLEIDMDPDKTAPGEEVGTIQSAFNQGLSDEFIFSDRAVMDDPGLDEYATKANVAKTANAVLNAKETDEALIQRVTDSLNSSADPPIR